MLKVDSPCIPLSFFSSFFLRLWWVLSVLLIRTDQTPKTFQLSLLVGAERMKFRGFRISHKRPLLVIKEWYTFCWSFSLWRAAKRERRLFFSSSIRAPSSSFIPVLRRVCFSFSCSNSFFSLLILVASSTTSLTVACVLTSFALEANCKVLRVSSMYLLNW